MILSRDRIGGRMQTIAGYRDHIADAQGLRFHYLEWGAANAPPMVLLHGLTGHAHIWDHMAPDLSGRFHLLPPDQRGHGETQHADSYTTSDFVQDLEALRAIWGIERFVLMGLSMGGHNAMAYTLAHPERVSHLIVIDIPPRLDPKTWETRKANEARAREGHPIFPTLDDAVLESRSGNLTAPDANLRYRTEWNVKEASGGLTLRWDPKVQTAWEPADLWSGISEVAAPTLLVRGGLTTVLPEDTAARMVAAFPDAELVEIPTSGHSVPTDRPEELTPLVVEWLSRRG